MAIRAEARDGSIRKHSFNAAMAMTSCSFSARLRMRMHMRVCMCMCVCACVCVFFLCVCVSWNMSGDWNACCERARTRQRAAEKRGTRVTLSQEVPKLGCGFGQAGTHSQSAQWQWIIRLCATTPKTGSSNKRASMNLQVRSVVPARTRCPVHRKTKKDKERQRKKEREREREREKERTHTFIR